MESVSLWKSIHRGALHDPSSWDTEDADQIHLTYVPTCYGFSTVEQLHSFALAFPANSHPFSPSQLGRFENKLESFGCYHDSVNKVVIEEAVISMYHHEQLDWFLPDIPPCRKQLQFSVVFIAKYGNSGKLRKVSVQWDQALLIDQVNALHHLSKSSSESISKLIPFAKTVIDRILSPNEANCKPYSPKQHEPTRLPSKKLALDGIKSLLSDLPDAPITPARHRKTPALDSSSLKTQIAGIFEESFPLKSSTALPHAISNIPFDSLSEVVVKPPGSKFVDNIFAPASEDYTIKSSFRVDKKRFESHLFDDPSPFKPTIAIDKARFESCINFEDAPPQIRENESRPHAVQSQLISNIAFGDDNVSNLPATPKPSENTRNTESQFQIGHDETTNFITSLTNPKAVDHNIGHFVGSGLEFAVNDSTQSNSNVPRTFFDRNTNHFEGTSFLVNSSAEPLSKTHQNSYNKSSIVFAEQEDPSSFPRTGTHLRGSSMASKNYNQSQVCFDDNASLPAHIPSQKITKPPGGDSQLVL